MAWRPFCPKNSGTPEQRGKARKEHKTARDSTGMERQHGWVGGKLRQRCTRNRRVSGVTLPPSPTVQASGWEHPSQCLYLALRRTPSFPLIYLISSGTMIFAAIIPLRTSLDREQYSLCRTCLAPSPFTHISVLLRQVYRRVPYKLRETSSSSYGCGRAYSKGLAGHGNTPRGISEFLRQTRLTLYLRPHYYATSTRFSHAIPSSTNFP